MHVLVRNAVEIPADLRDHVRDVSSYPEMQELYLASDVLVTDYSSVFFDYAALRRPMVFYAYDIERYRDDVRGFYLDYESLIPGPLVTTESELLDTLQRLDVVDAQYAQQRERFLRRFAPHDDARSAARVVDAVFGAEPGAEDGLG
jgi:CDP-glycerol glycerophosphotransferase